MFKYEFRFTLDEVQKRILFEAIENYQGLLESCGFPDERDALAEVDITLNTCYEETNDAKSKD